MDPPNLGVLGSASPHRATNDHPCIKDMVRNLFYRTTRQAPFMSVPAEYNARASRLQLPLTWLPTHSRLSLPGPGIPACQWALSFIR